MKLQLFFWVFIFISGLVPYLEAGEIYQWIDKDGGQHFTDGPPPPGAKIVEGLSETPAIEPPANNGATAPKDAGTVEGGENNPPDRGDTGAIEGGENSPTDREDYWRRKGWGNGSTDREDSGAVQGGKNSPADREDTGAAEGEGKSPTDPEEPGSVEGGENGPTDRRLE